MKENFFMLEVRNLKRVYKLKNAEPVYALNDVSLKFPETGLVFILGKSGSGKSTLLNVMGGLDKADDGEIIINGKSSKEFTGSEMDSYRNTYLGFIFQEYNILSDFTVGENIGLALQLQHKKATPEAIDDILSQVDLSGFAKRKPNELSGGQKQRVAIARALVKEPKIIFGDEPTGALDSNTGKQVFETLKKLSKDKLVVIVSHDRDFAEHFGDRVIELKDGVVISDITKTSVESQKVNEGISIIGDNIIHIQHNHMLTLSDLDVINQTLSKNGKDAFITIDEHVNEAVCEAARIDKSGNREEFVSTDDSKIDMGNDEFSAIKSRFSLGHAFRMGAKSLRVKPFRLAMTIILSTVAFSLFGVSATLSTFNTKKAVISTAERNDINNVSINYREKHTSGYGNNKGFTQERIDEIKEKTGVQVYKLKSTSFVTMNVPSNTNQDYFHLRQYQGSMDIDEATMNDLGLSLYRGSLPKNEDEVCISLYAYYSYKDLGIGSSKNNSDYVKPEDVTEDKVIGQTISLDYYSDDEGPTSYKITGILDTRFPKKYEQYRTTTLNDQSSDYTAIRYFNGYSSCIHNILFTGKNADATTDSPISIPSQYFQYQIERDSEKKYSINVSSGYYPSHKNVIYFDDAQTSLKSGQGLTSLNLLSTINIDQGSDSVEPFTVTFDGAYQTPETDSLFTATFNYLDYRQIKNAAIYKTCYDKYEDFYQNHLDIVKKINNGEYEMLHNDGKNFISDYTSVDKYQKYNMFQIYLYYFISGASQESYFDVNNRFYYDEYKQNYKTYCEKVYKSLPSSNIQKITGYLSAYREEYINDYAFKNAISIYEEYKDSEDMKYIISKNDIDGELTQNQKAMCGRQYISFFSDSFLGTEFYTSYKSFLSNFDLKNLKQTVQFSLGFSNSSDSIVKNVSFEIVGIDLDSNREFLNMTKEDVITIRTELEKMNYALEQTISVGIIGFGENREKLEKFLDYYLPKKKLAYDDYDSLEEGYWYLVIEDGQISNVENTSSMIVMLTKVFLYVGIGLALFAALLFYNFMSISINNKKREIGILRAVGAKRIDVFKIFYSEAFIISVINFILSTIITFVLSFLVNQDTVETLKFNIMEPSMWIVLMLFGISILVSFVSAFLPVTKIANKKPIDAIQNR